MNVIDTVTLAGTLVLALPIGMLGVEFLLTGRPVAGVGFVAVAAALVLGQHYLEPDVKSRIAGGIVERVVPDGDGDEETTDGQSGAADRQPGTVDIPSARADAHSGAEDAQSAPEDTQRTADEEEVQRT